jgi:hypothetical protein
MHDNHSIYLADHIIANGALLQNCVLLQRVRDINQFRRWIIEEGSALIRCSDTGELYEATLDDATGLCPRARTARASELAKCDKCGCLHWEADLVAAPVTSDLSVCHACYQELEDSLYWEQFQKTQYDYYERDCSEGGIWTPVSEEDLA